MAWLLRDGEVLATIEVAASTRARLRGLAGRDHLEGGLLLEHVRSVHSICMRFPIDVAFLDSEMTVLSTVTLVPFRAALPRPAARSVLEAEAGAFDRWGLRRGDRLEVRP